MTARRGDIWLVDFGEPVGREQAGRRPAVVVSADPLNDSRAGVVGLEVTLTGHRLHGGVPLPGEVAARAPGARVALRLRWTSVEVNRPVEPGLFRLAPPDGARVVDLPPAAP